MSMESFTQPKNTNENHAEKLKEMLEKEKETAVLSIVDIGKKMNIADNDDKYRATAEKLKEGKIFTSITALMLSLIPVIAAEHMGNPDIANYAGYALGGLGIASLASIPLDRIAYKVQKMISGEKYYSHEERFNLQLQERDAEEKRDKVQGDLEALK